jgi:FMN phosphatase YigB (HAD superfamily)
MGQLDAGAGTYRIDGRRERMTSMLPTRRSKPRAPLRMSIEQDLGVLRAVLVDVGGTLWPNVWPQADRDELERVGRLRNAVPLLEADEARALVRAARSLPQPATERQQTEKMTAAAIRAVNPSTSVPARALMAAVCLPAKGRVRLFPGARDLLAALAGHGLRVVIVSNVVWRDVEAHRRDFDDFGLSDHVDAYVTSVDVGWRKPHAVFFDVALDAADQPAERCAMVGDSETNDIVPAHDRGMITVRVAIEEPAPASTVADHLCHSLNEVADALLA